MIEGSHGRNEVGETYFLDLQAFKEASCTNQNCFAVNP